ESCSGAVINVACWRGAACDPGNALVCCVSLWGSAGGCEDESFGVTAGASSVGFGCRGRSDAEWSVSPAGSIRRRARRGAGLGGVAGVGWAPESCSACAADLFDIDPTSQTTQ